jgi:hypothetical protein
VRRRRVRTTLALRFAHNSVGVISPFAPSERRFPNRQE